MTDSYGALGIPVPAPGATDTPGDPLLDDLAAYLKACVNTYALAAWTAIAGAGRGDPVKTTQTNNPDDSTFNTADLPALYIWRDEQDERYERIADDWEICIAQIHVMWVPNPAVQVRRARWSSFLKAIAKVVDYAIWNGRDPAWVKAGDTDPDAATRGTLLWRSGGLVYEPGQPRSRVVPLEITMADGSPKRDYQGIHCMIETREKMDASNAARLGTLYPSKIDATVTDGAVVVEYENPFP